MTIEPPEAFFRQHGHMHTFPPRDQAAGNGNGPPPGEDDDPFGAEGPGEEANNTKPDVFELLGLTDIATLKPPAYLVDKLLATASLAVIYGPPGCGKSFVALDLSLSIAHGLPWQGRATQQGSVVYIAGEGLGGIRKRIQAWRDYHECTDDSVPFCLIRSSVNLVDASAAGDVHKLARTLRGGHQLVTVDTLSRAFVGGDENSAQDMGQFIANCDLIREASGRRSVPRDPKPREPTTYNPSAH